MYDVLSAFTILNSEYKNNTHDNKLSHSTRELVQQKIWLVFYQRIKGENALEKQSCLVGLIFLNYVTQITQSSTVRIAVSSHYVLCSNSS